jgi:hypothetical protein
MLSLFDTGILGFFFAHGKVYGEGVEGAAFASEAVDLQ